MSRILPLHGPLDTAHACDVRPLLHQASLSGGELVIDLSAVTRIDGTGLGMLAAARERVRRRGGQFRIVGARPDVLGSMSADRVLALLSDGGRDLAAPGAAASRSRLRLRRRASSRGVLAVRTDRFRGVPVASVGDSASGRS